MLREDRMAEDGGYDSHPEDETESSSDADRYMESGVDDVDVDVDDGRI